VIDAGAGDWSASWAVVQREIAELTKVCTYDRAGYGWSEPAPGPMTARQSAGELHALLERAGVPGPFVLAGHSAGGLTVRLFAHDYPEEVAGVVFIDSMTPDEHASGSGEQVRSGRSILESILPSLARLGFMRALSVPLTLAKIVPGTQSQIASSVTPRFFSAVQDEYLGLSGSLAQASKVRSLGDLPVIVLSASLGNDAEWQKDQTSLLELSSSSEQLFAEHSGHNIQQDEPQAAVDAISKMAGQIRSERSR
jgi:pimeloyl-ACP methyl ester carboxylesterase